MQNIKNNRTNHISDNGLNAVATRCQPDFVNEYDHMLAIHALSRIDQFVSDIEESDETGFVMRQSLNDAITVKWLELAKDHYRHIGQLQAQFSASPVYSLRVQVFFEACVELEIIDDTHFGLMSPDTIHPATEKTCAELFNELIAEIRKVCRSAWFKTKLQYRKGRAKDNENRALAFEEDMFGWRSRHLVIVLHFGYLAEHRGEITEEVIREHRDRFFNGRRSNRLLNGIKGFIWVIEQGETSGLHLHVILFYSAEYRHDVMIAKRLGEYWVRVATRGIGQYWNGNARKKFYEKRGYGDGTGTIDRTNLKKRTALRKTIRYLTKDEQRLLSKTGEHVRSFQTSQVPEKHGMGRPRRHVNVALPSVPFPELEADIIDPVVPRFCMI